MNIIIQAFNARITNYMMKHTCNERAVKSLFNHHLHFLRYNFPIDMTSINNKKRIFVFYCYVLTDCIQEGLERMVRCYNTIS